MIGSNKSQNCQVTKAENGWVLNYFLNEYGPDLNRNVNRQIIVTDVTEIGAKLVELFE